eukprot:6051538-Amphidinium_carterae.1
MDTGSLKLSSALWSLPFNSAQGRLKARLSTGWVYPDRDGCKYVGPTCNLEKCASLRRPFRCACATQCGGTPAQHFYSIHAPLR